MKNFVYYIFIFTILLLTGCADAGKDQTVSSGTRVTLDGSGSTASFNGTLKRYHWKQILGNKITLADRNSIKSTFIAANVTKETRFLFSLTTIERGGNISPFITRDYVNIIIKPTINVNQSPHAIATVSSDKIKEGENVIFDATKSNDSDGNITSYSWKDATGIELSTERRFVHTFTSAGKFTVILTVTDDDGAKDSTHVSIDVNTLIKPIARIRTNHTNIKINESVIFDANQSSDSDGEIVSYKWLDEFNNTLSDLVSFTYTFTTAGEHTITLEVSDDDGQISRVSVTLTVIESVDTIKPVITLNGESDVILKIGGIYSELGATANDNKDGDITANIEIGGDTVDTNTVGTYTITYNVNDSAGNVADTVNRVVNIIPNQNRSMSLWAIGDSTVAQYDDLHEKGGELDHRGGWAEMMWKFTKSKEHVHDYARPGASSKSFYEIFNGYPTKNFWEKQPKNNEVGAKKSLEIFISPENGAFLFIQFGHNDGKFGNNNVKVFANFEPGQYADYLTKYVREAKQIGAIPVLVTPVSYIRVSENDENLHQYDGMDGHGGVGDYPAIMKEVARRENVLLLDLTQKSYDYFRDHFENNETILSAYGADYVHTNLEGATQVAKLVKELACEYQERNQEDATLLCAQFKEVEVNEDTIKPVITLNGESDFTLIVGGVYTELGATANDNKDGDITANIAIAGDTVDTNTVGTYTITYDVNDSAGNVADTVKRVVNVSEENSAFFSFDGHTYEMIKSPKSWQEASQDATNKGGYLVHINSQEENDEIYARVHSYVLADELQQTIAADGGHISYVWLGGSDVATNHTWKWSDDNSIFSQGINAIAGVYENWGKVDDPKVHREPDDWYNDDLAPDGQDFLAMAIDNPLKANSNMGNHHHWPWGLVGEWNDVAIGNTLFYVIEYNKEADKDDLQVTVTKSDSGITLQSIKDKNTELLNQAVDLFYLTIRSIQNKKDENITASSGWGSISMVTIGKNQTITLTHPTDNVLPSTLKATITIATENNQSQWDLSVTGLGKNYSLMEVSFPNFNIKSSGEDDFFLPYHFGRVVHNPATKIDLSYGNGLYPRGWGATMQYLAYYNTDYGIYFGFHDPKASRKEFRVKNENGGVKIGCKIPIPNKTIANNSWKMPGKFVLDVYKGDWYEAALKYKKWVYANAEYRPVDTPNRVARQKNVGAIGVWAQDDIIGRVADTDSVENYVRGFKAFMDVPIGVHWIGWYNKPHDTDFPEIFPELAGLGGVISRLQASYGNDIFIQAYMNGALYDSNLASYEDEAEEDTVKDLTKDLTKVEAHIYKGTTLRHMCPTRNRWQSIMVDSVKQITSRLGMEGVYIDMVTASSPLECMDSNHTHPLGGGHYWRDGYKKMFKTMHETIPEGKFITSEAANDFLVDEVDLFLTEGFIVEGQVPAFQAVYGGKVQFIGPSGVGGYDSNASKPDSQNFYGRLAQSFSFGIIPGRVYMTIVQNQNVKKQRAANYIRRLARLRVKLKDFFSFGEMKKPLEVHGNIPNITFDPSRHSSDIAIGKVVIPAIQTSTWSDGESIVVTVVNGKVPEVADEAITFSFDFDASRYGLNGDIQIKEITEDSDGEYQASPSQFTKTVTLKSYESKAFIISAK